MPSEVIALAPFELPGFMLDLERPVPCSKRPDLFVNYGDKGAARIARARDAAAPCWTCPVRRACLAWGKDHRQDGVYGGEDLRLGRPYYNRGRGRAAS